MSVISNLAITERIEQYTEELSGIIQDEQATYEVFSNFYEVVADSFEKAVTCEIKASQLDQLAQGLEGNDYPVLPSNEGSWMNLLETTADIYDELGIISSETKRAHTREGMEEITVYYVSRLPRQRFQ